MPSHIELFLPHRFWVLICLCMVCLSQWVILLTSDDTLSFEFRLSLHLGCFESVFWFSKTSQVHVVCHICFLWRLSSPKISLKTLFISVCIQSFHASEGKLLYTTPSLHAQCINLYSKQKYCYFPGPIVCVIPDNSHEMGWELFWTHVQYPNWYSILVPICNDDLYASLYVSGVYDK